MIPERLIGVVTCGDCMQLMSDLLPDECIDLTITSPPYDNLRDYHGYTFEFESIADQLIRVTKPGGVIVWVVADAVIDGSETGTSFRQALYFKDNGLCLHDTMIFKKGGSSLPDPTRYHQNFEYMFVLSKGRPKTIHLIADRKNRWHRPWGRTTVRERDGSLVPRVGRRNHSPFGVRFNVWEYLVGKGHTTKDDFAWEHPAVFPEALARDHIISWSDPGDLVFDPMSGSGTVGKMSKALGRKFLGFEISPKYTELANRRLQSIPEILPGME